MKAAYLRYAIQRCCCCIKKLNCYKVILEFHIHCQPDLCSFAWVRFFCAKKASVNHISVKDRGLLQLGFNWVWGDGIRIDPFAKCLRSQSTKNPSLASLNNITKNTLPLTETRKRKGVKLTYWQSCFSARHLKHF